MQGNTTLDNSQLIEYLSVQERKTNFASQSVQNVINTFDKKVYKAISGEGKTKTFPNKFSLACDDDFEINQDYLEINDEEDVRYKIASIKTLSGKNTDFVPKMNFKIFNGNELTDVLQITPSGLNVTGSVDVSGELNVNTIKGGIVENGVSIITVDPDPDELTSLPSLFRSWGRPLFCPVQEARLSL